MRIDCYLSPECKSEDALKANVIASLEKESITAKVTFHRIDNETALSLGLSGSPSVFINGKEIQPLDAIGFS